MLETQENTRAIQAQSYLALTSQLNRLRENLLDPEVASVFTKGMLNRESLASRADQLIFGQLFEAAFAIYESAYYARQKGILDESEWSRFDAAVCRNMRNGATIWAPNSSVVLGPGIRGTLTDSFANYVEEHCDWASIKAGLRSGTDTNE